jgi:hypothetical protein
MNTLRSRVPVTLTAALPALLLLVGCGDAPSGGGWAGTVDTLESGVVLVSSPEAGVWTGETGWRLVEELRIGSALEEGPDMFGSVVAIEADDEGRIYVADSQAQEVRVFGADGGHLFTVGRKGGGPGEFAGITGMGWGPDGNLWVMDATNSRFAVFDRSGVHVADHRRPGGFVMMPWPGGFDADSGVYDIGMVADGSGRFSSGLIRYHYLGEGGIEPRDTFAIPRYDGPSFTLQDSEGRTRIMASVPLAPGQVWQLAHGHLWMGTTDAYRLHRVSFEGDTVRIVQRAFTPAPVTAAEKDSAVTAMKWFTDQGGRVDRSRIPDQKPAYRNVFEDDAGYLWVWPHLAAGEPEGLDLFDPDGRYLGRALTPVVIPTFPRPVVRGDRFYTVVHDDLEIPYVARFGIHGRDPRLAGGE